MLFNSYNFILAFLPISLLLFYTVNRRCAKGGKIILLLLSVFFICCNGIYHGAVAVGSALTNFFICKQMSGNERHRKSLLTLGILFNVGLLCIFKYIPLAGVSLAFPLGVSFYCFQQIAFLVDQYHESTPVTLMDYSLFVLFYPKAVQGPIPYGGELLPQFQQHSAGGFSFERLSQSLYLFAIGLAKKVLVADSFAIIADYGFGAAKTLTAFEALLTILAYSLQLYFDFSGYSDMAVAVGRMFGFELPVNFDSPYKAKNITDFWRRWHITLSRFLTKYIYIPLGGNRKGVVRTCLNILIVYLVSGIWHGTGATFLIWGLLHALASIAYRLLKKFYDRIPNPIQWLTQFVFINITWVFFRASSLETAGVLLERLWKGKWLFAINVELTESLLQPTFISIAAQFLPVPVVVLLGFAGALGIVVFAKNSTERSRDFHPSIRSLCITYLLLLISILSLAGVSGFLYTNF